MGVVSEEARYVLIEAIGASAAQAEAVNGPAVAASLPFAERAIVVRASSPSRSRPRCAGHHPTARGDAGRLYTELCWRRAQ
jgi:hypothetical protein